MKPLAAILTLTVIACGPSRTDFPKIQFTASGGTLATLGYDFPPAAGANAFVDGWQVHIDEMLVTFDKLTVTENPDLFPSDQAQAGLPVAEIDGPWAVDLAKQGPLAGALGGADTAVPIATVDNQNLVNGRPFDETVRYAIGYSVVVADASATQVNLDATAQADYATMVTNGYAVLYVGTATWKGDATCTLSSPPNPLTFPKTQTVSFRLGFKSPASYINCQDGSNPAPGLSPGGSAPNEAHPRGIQPALKTTVNAQITMQTPRPFSESLLFDAPVHFDMLAVLAHADGTVSLDDTQGIDPTNLSNHSGQSLPWRDCVDGNWTIPFPAATQTAFDVQGISVVGEIGQPQNGFRDLGDYMTFSQSTQGQLNGAGSCFVQQSYASPVNNSLGEFGQSSQ